jgi:hypothetical protein
MPKSTPKNNNNKANSSFLLGTSPRRKNAEGTSPIVMASVAAGEKDAGRSIAEVIPLQNTVVASVAGAAEELNSRTAGVPSTHKSPQNPRDVEEKVTKCNWNKCNITNMEEAISCVVTTCKKTMHPTCMECFVDKAVAAAWLDRETLGKTIVCSKTCYSKHIALSKRKPTWSNDGEKGPDDPNTSEKILLDWLLEEGNYANKWRGKDSKGRTKKQIAGELASLINAAKVRVKRDDKQVMNKISHIEKSFRCAHDFANTETGQGLKENDPSAFDEAVKGKCIFYFDLLEIFGDRASATPKALSSGNLDSSEDEVSIERPESYDGSFSGIDSDDGSGMEDFIIDGDSPKKQTNQKKRTNSDKKKPPVRVVKPKTSVTSGGSSSKKKNVISLLDESTTGELASLAQAQEQLARAKLELIQNEKTLNDLRLQMNKFQMLKEIRQSNPNLTKTQIVQMFPALAELADVMMVDDDSD